jgi:hypothetical protein
VTSDDVVAMIWYSFMVERVERTTSPHSTREIYMSMEPADVLLGDFVNRRFIGRLAQLVSHLIEVVVIKGGSRYWLWGAQDIG